MLKVHSSRRVAGLKDGDFDHEISLVDHDGATSRQPVSMTVTGDGGDIRRTSTTSPLLGTITTATDRTENGLSPTQSSSGDNVRIQERPLGELEHEQGLPHVALRPSIEIQEPTPDAFHGNAPHVKPPKPQVERETAIDILYENERGGFLCGMPLFSSKALGNLDPTPWTNAYHKPSPTSIHTATVPDPSWDWAWPEWHVNQQEGMDEGGWEYSFAFSKKFSWHGARWWNSFVRRRAWTRKRAKRRPEDISSDLHMLSSDYFTIRPASERTRGSQGSRPSSRVPSKTSLSQASSTEMVEARPDIEDIETLLRTLRFARIDREKLEAVENYLENAIDLGQLEGEMHEIMSIFIFQASRRLLLSRLMQIYDETKAKLEASGGTNSGDEELHARRDALKAAIKHADEEVRRLAYWSDIKQMAETGEVKDAVDEHKGWDEIWEGVDQSGPTQPNSGKLPGPLGKEEGRRRD